MIKLSMLIICVTFGSVAVADPVNDTTQTKLLSSIYANMMKQYAELKKQLNEAQQANDFLYDVKETSKDLVEEYKFVNNFSLEAHINMVKSDIMNLTYLDSFSSNMTMLEKIELMNAEMDKRITNQDGANRKEVDRIRRHYLKLIQLEELAKAKSLEAQKAGLGEMNDKTLTSSNASSNAIMASMLLAEEAEKLEALEKRNASSFELIDSYKNFMNKGRNYE